jgi:hypothetical protein
MTIIGASSFLTPPYLALAIRRAGILTRGISSLPDQSTLGGFIGMVAEHLGIGE